MRKVSPAHIFGLTLILSAVAVSGVLLFSDGKLGEAALDSKFIEQVGLGFIAPACGSSSVNDDEFICNADGTVTAKIHWYPEKIVNKTQCSDGIDDDDSGTPDDNCASPQDDGEGVPGLQSVQCSDNIDNDGDGFRDYPDDPGCIGGPGNNFEAAEMPQCSDGIDNPVDDSGDGNVYYNGLIDYPQDPGCVSANDDAEDYNVFGGSINKTPACSDGIDNDGNLLIDYSGNDPGCASASDPREWNPISWCKYVNFFDDRTNASGFTYFGQGTPCYKGPTEGFLYPPPPPWPPLPQNTVQQYRVYASNEPTAVGGHLFNEGNNFGIVSFTTPICALFNYSLSNSGTSNVTKTSGNAFTQNTITKALTSGTTEPVTLSLSGVPGGTSYSISNSACSPTCTSVITFTVSPSTRAGTYPITVTGSPLGRQTNFNLVISGNPINATCSASPGIALLGQTVTWTAAVSGGTPPFTYSWSGTGIPTSPPPSTNPFSIVYSTIGQKTATVTVTDTDSVAATCPAGVVQVNFNPNFEEF